MPAAKVTDAVCVTTIPSVVSEAVYATVCAAVSETANVALPAASVVGERGVTTDDPVPAASATVLPATGLDWASRSVTVTVEKLEPSAATVAGEAATEDCAAVTAPARKLTAAVCVTVIVSIVSVAVEV